MTFPLIVSALDVSLNTLASSLTVPLFRFDMKGLSSQGSFGPNWRGFLSSQHVHSAGWRANTFRQQYSTQASHSACSVESKYISDTSLQSASTTKRAHKAHLASDWVDMETWCVSGMLKHRVSAHMCCRASPLAQDRWTVSPIFIPI